MTTIYCDFWLIERFLQAKDSKGVSLTALDILGILDKNGAEEGGDGCFNAQNP